MALSLTGFNLILSHQRQARYSQVFLRHMHFPDDPIAGGRVFDTTPPALKAVRLDHLLHCVSFPIIGVTLGKVIKLLIRDG